MEQLIAQYHQLVGIFRPLFFFHYWGPHPEFRNKDITQMCEIDLTLDRCYWRSHGKKPLRHGAAAKMTYTLCHGRNDAPKDSSKGYSLVECRFKPEFYVGQAAENKLVFGEVDTWSATATVESLPKEEN